MNTKTLSRRKLIKNTTLASIAGSLYFNLPINVFGEQQNPKTRVVLVRHKDVIKADGFWDSAGND